MPPFDIEKEAYNHYQTVTNEDGTKSRKKVGQVSFREIRILSDDQKHQTAIVTNITKTFAAPNVISAPLFERWGNQENVFNSTLVFISLDFQGK